MSVELKADTRHRYMMYRSDDMGLMSFSTPEKKQEVIDAGKKFTAAAYADIWAKDAGLVQRTRQFLRKNFHWHERLAKGGADLDVVQTLQDMVRSGSIVIIREEPRRSGGSVGVSAPIRKQTFHEEVMEKMGLSVDAAWEYIDWYNSVVQRLDEYEAARKKLTANAASSVDDAASSTSLGEAQLFEYGDGASAHLPTGDSQLAWLPRTGGAANKWVLNPSGSGQMRFYDGNGNAAVDFDFDHDHGFGMPHAHNWDGNVRDQGNAFSLLPY